MVIVEYAQMNSSHTLPKPKGIKTKLNERMELICRKRCKKLSSTKQGYISWLCIIMFNSFVYSLLFTYKVKFFGMTLKSAFPFFFNLLWTFSKSKENDLILPISFQFLRLICRYFLVLNSVFRASDARRRFPGIEMHVDDKKVKTPCNCLHQRFPFFCIR